MNVEMLRALRGLLDTEPVLTAAVVVDGEPVAALLPFVPGPEYTSLIVQVSGLARHARGLHDGAAIGVVVHEAATRERDPMQLTRLSVGASVQTVARDDRTYASIAARLVARFPAAATTLALADFRICALVLGRGRFVQGFARTFNVGPDTFRQLGA